MKFTVIRKNGTIEHISTIGMDPSLQAAVDALNTNPLCDAKYTIGEEYGDDNLYPSQIGELLGLEYNRYISSY